MTGRPNAASISALASGRSGSAPQLSSPRRDAQPSAPHLAGQAVHHRGIGEQISRLEAVQPLDDLGERQGGRERACPRRAAASRRTCAGGSRSDGSSAQRRRTLAGPHARRRRSVAARTSAVPSRARSQPALEVPDEHAAPSARAAGRHDLVLAEQVRRTLRCHALEMRLGQLERQPAVGDDLVPVLHHIGLRHRRDGRQVRARDRVDIDAGETLGVPRRPRLRGPQQRPQALIAKTVKPLQRPRQALGLDRQPVSERPQVPLTVRVELARRALRSHARSSQRSAAALKPVGPPRREARGARPAPIAAGVLLLDPGCPPPAGPAAHSAAAALTPAPPVRATVRCAHAAPARVRLPRRCRHRPQPVRAARAPGAAVGLRRGRPAAAARRRARPVGHVHGHDRRDRRGRRRRRARHATRCARSRSSCSPGSASRCCSRASPRASRRRSPRLSRYGPRTRGDGFASGPARRRARSASSTRRAPGRSSPRSSRSARPPGGRSRSRSRTRSGSAAVLLALCLGGRRVLDRVRAAGRGPLVQRGLGRRDARDRARSSSRTSTSASTSSSRGRSRSVNLTASLERSDAVAKRLHEINGRKPKFTASRLRRPSVQAAGATGSCCRQLGDWRPTSRTPQRLVQHPRRPAADARVAARRGVVLVDFWTYTCINCLRTLPYLEAWDARYRADGLTIVGVHTPEFAFEHDAGNVANAIKRLGITLPGRPGQRDGHLERLRNMYWPADYLIDSTGQVRYAGIRRGRLRQDRGGDPLAARGRRPQPPRGGRAAAGRRGPVGPDHARDVPRHRRARTAGRPASPSRAAHVLRAPRAGSRSTSSPTAARGRSAAQAATAGAGATIDAQVEGKHVYLVLSSAGPEAAAGRRSCSTGGR